MSAAEALQHEIEHLVDVCEQLDLLADKHPLVWESLLGIAGSLRESIRLLGVLLISKMSDWDSRNQGGNWLS